MILYVVVPCYNEIKTLKNIIDSILAIKLNIKIILIDDGSTDGTKNLIKKKIKKKIYKFINLRKNHGKGYAINQSKKFITKKSIVIIQDADLEYFPNDFYKILDTYKKNKSVKVVYGSRLYKKKFSKLIYSFNNSYIRIFANKFLTFISNVLNGQNLTDAHTCYKSFYSSIFKKIKLEEKGFSFCPEINTKLALMGYKIHEVPIKYFSRSKKMGKKITYKDAFYAIKAIILHRYFKK